MRARKVAQIALGGKRAHMARLNVVRGRPHFRLQEVNDGNVEAGVASAGAQARPMPRAPPVTRAVFVIGLPFLTR
ncbi:MAG: hypothetical protein JO283_05770 [Bradyrhizobium sp.]|nr:hypothetical protein [Bradyrhizobium sp.]